MKNWLCQILSCTYQNKSNFGKHWLHSLAVKIEMKMGYGVFIHSVVYLTAWKPPDGLVVWMGRGKILHDKEPGIKPVWWYHSRVRWVGSQRSCPHHTPPRSSRSWVKNSNTSIQIILIFSLSTENNAVYYFFSWNKKTSQRIVLAEQSAGKGIMANCVCLL